MIVMKKSIVNLLSDLTFLILLFFNKIRSFINMYSLRGTYSDKNIIIFPNAMGIGDFFILLNSLKNSNVKIDQTIIIHYNIIYREILNNENIENYYIKNNVFSPFKLIYKLSPQKYNALFFASIGYYIFSYSVFVSYLMIVFLNSKAQIILATRQGSFTQLFNKVVKYNLKLTLGRNYFSIFNGYFEKEDFSNNYIQQLSKRNKSEKIIIIHPFSNENQKWKRWPIINFLKLARMISDVGFKVCFVGNKSEQLEFGEFLTDKGKFEFIVGKNGIMNIVELIKKAQIVISNDSAYMHVANYYYKPFIAIFGPTDPKRTLPIFTHPLSMIIRKNIVCSPCHTIESNFNPNFCEINYKCLNNISAQTILNEFLKILQKSTDSNTNIKECASIRVVND